MCTLSEPAAPASPAQALAMLHSSLGYLAGCDAAGLGTATQAEALIGLEQAEAQHTAARASPSPPRLRHHIRIDQVTEHFGEPARAPASPGRSHSGS